MEAKSKAEFDKDHASRLEKTVEDRMCKHLDIAEVAIEESEEDEDDEESNSRRTSESNIMD